MADPYLIDSNIYDKIVDEPGALALVTKLVGDGKIKLLTTHVQADEIADAPGPKLASLSTVPTERVATYGFVLGVSRIGEARLSPSQPLESLRDGKLKHTEDALIGASAGYENATLVTEDRRLRNRALAENIPALDWQAFHARLLAL